MKPFHQGQTIVCVDDRPGDKTNTPVPLRSGKQYSPTNVFRCPSCGDWVCSVGIPAPASGVMIHSCGAKLDATETGWLHRATRFVPIEEFQDAAVDVFTLLHDLDILSPSPTPICQPEPIRQHKSKR